MAFALTLFVEAANRRISSTAIIPGDNEVCDYLYSTLCAEVDSLPLTERPQTDHHSTLQKAFSVLCSYYDGDPLQAAVCARVLAFHFMMERTAGAALADWVQPLPDKPHLVALHPAVIEAVASVQLSGSVLLPERRLLQLVEEKAASTGDGPIQ